MKADDPLVARGPSRARRAGKEPAAARPAAAPRPAPRGPRPFRWLARLFAFGFALLLALGVGGAIAGFVLYQHYAADLPDHERLVDYQPPVMSRVYAGDGRLLAELATERRIFVPVESIPPLVRQAFLSAEDQNFYSHRGVDPIAVARAVLTNVQNLGQNRRPVGASTITQQVAKNMLLGNEVSLARKAREAILSIRMEQALSKDRILELYLNEIFLGRGAYGVASAAMTYFNKALDELTPAEAAFLAALPKAPNNYDPFRFPDAAKARRDWVLDRMAEDRGLTPEQAGAAKAEPVVVRAGRLAETVPAAWYAEEVRRQLVDRFGAEAATQGGLLVRTSLDPDLQVAADRALREGLMAFDRRRGGWRGPVGLLDMPPAQFATGWTQALANAQPPAGTPRDWRLAAVLSVDATEARVGLLERATRPGVPPQPKILPLPMAELAWARRALEGGQGLGTRLGPVPRRPADVLQPGQVVLVEILPPTQGTPAEPGARGRPGRPAVAGLPERASLRQVPQVEGAVVALDPRTGRVLALSGGFSFDRSQFNRATQAQRQPGSSFKPFVYIAALEQGIPPSERILDAPFEIPQPNGQVWRPQNYTREVYGPTPMRIGMEKSRNLMTIRLAMDERVGLARVADAARRFGVIPNMLQVPSMALGAGETTVLRQAAAYGIFANGGREITPTLIDSVQDREGKVVFRADARDCSACSGAQPTEAPPALPDTRREVTDPASAFQMTSLLQGVIQRGTGGRAALGNRPVAGKTGTSNDYVDAWFVGYTPDLVVAVWVGRDDNQSLGEGETGGGVAAPIFQQVMSAAMQGRPNLPFRTPPGIRLLRVNPETGLPAWSGERHFIWEAFKPGTEPGREGGTPIVGTSEGLGGVY